MNWFELEDTKSVISPNLLVFPDRIKSNIQKMLEVAKEAARLRPHIKTHKMAEIIEIQQNMGIHKFKCSTIAEAELLARKNAKDILLAMQPAGIDQDRLFSLAKRFQNSKFSTLVDNPETLRELSSKASINSMVVELWLDLNTGMNRTGINPGQKAMDLYKLICDDRHVLSRGFHIYDGHIHDSNYNEREKNCLQSFSQVVSIKEKLDLMDYPVSNMVIGGTPTFPIFSQATSYELSPGTPVLWDAGYQIAFPDMNYEPAAVLLTRIVSKPAKDLLCLDLGHKSLASEMALPRVIFLGEHRFNQISQSEEHLVVSCPDHSNYSIGQVIYALPIHVCPTVAKYPSALCVDGHSISGKWSVSARDQILI